MGIEKIVQKVSELGILEDDNVDEVGEGEFVVADVGEPAIDVHDVERNLGLELGNDGAVLALTQVLAVRFGPEPRHRNRRNILCSSLLYDGTALINIYIHNMTGR